MAHDRRQRGTSRRDGHISSLVGACILALALKSSVLDAQTLHARTPLTALEIINAMQDRQLPTAGVLVTFAIPMTSAVPNPTLKIQDVTPIDQHDVRLRMACLDRSECLPFFAVATYAAPVNLAEFQLKASGTTSAAARLHPEAKATVDARTLSTTAKLPISVEPPVLRSGSPATLDFDGDRVHVRVEVICLESGATGDKIRVTTRDRKQTYVAEIVAPKALKGTLTQ